METEDTLTFVCETISLHRAFRAQKPHMSTECLESFFSTLMMHPVINQMVDNMENATE